MPLVQPLEGSNSLNPTRDAYEQKSAQLQQERDQAQKQKDNDFHTVVKYAADGFVDEAKYYAQSKGLEVPEQVFQNADLARGLALAGDFYGDDKLKAKTFTMAYANSPGTAQQKLEAGYMAAGDPVNPDDREFNRRKRWAEYEASRPKPRSPYENYKTVGGVMYRIEPNGQAVPVTPEKSQIPEEGKFLDDFLSDAQRASLVPIDVQETIARGKEAYASLYGAPQAPARPSGLVQPLPQQQPTPQPVQPQPQASPQAQRMKNVYLIQELLMDGETPEQVQQGLIGLGYSPQLAQQLVNEALGR